MSDRDRERDPGEREDFFRALSIPLLAHELKGPLAVIEAGVVTALERAAAGADAAKLEKTLRRVLRGTRRAQALVDDLLEVGRAEAGQVDRASFQPALALIAAVVDAVEAMDAELADRVAGVVGNDDEARTRATIAALGDGGVEVSIAERARDAAVDQDQRKFSLIVANLARNALRFKRARVAIALDVESGVARVTVEDDGPGVADADRRRIFERWAQGADTATGSRQGHGLGLAAARVLARSMGGDVTLAEGSNSRFVLTMPAASPR